MKFLKCPEWVKSTVSIIGMVGATVCYYKAMSVWPESDVGSHTWFAFGAMWLIGMSILVKL